LESRNEGDDNFKVKRGVFCCREGECSLISRRRKYGNIEEVAEATAEYLDEEGMFKKSGWPSR
jgi:hypothetical protein